MMEPNDNCITGFNHENLEHAGRRKGRLTEFKEDNGCVNDADNPLLAQTEVSLIEISNSMNDMQEIKVGTIKGCNETVKKHEEKCPPELIEISDDSSSDGDKSIDSSSDSCSEDENIVITVTTSQKSRDKINKKERTIATITIDQSSDSSRWERKNSKHRGKNGNQSRYQSETRKVHDEKGTITEKSICLWLDAQKCPGTFSSHCPIPEYPTIEGTNISTNLNSAKRFEEPGTRDLPCPEKTVDFAKEPVFDERLDSHNQIKIDDASTISNVATTSQANLKRIHNVEIQQNLSDPELFTIDDEEPISCDKSFSSNVTVLAPIERDEQSDEYPVFGVSHIKNDKDEFTKRELCEDNADMKFRRNIDFENQEIENILLSDEGEERNQCSQQLLQSKVTRESCERFIENSRDRREVKEEYGEAQTPRYRDKKAEKESSGRNSYSKCNNNNEKSNFNGSVDNGRKTLVTSIVKTQIAAEESVRKEINQYQSTSMSKTILITETFVDCTLREKKIAGEGNEVYDGKRFNEKVTPDRKRRSNQADYEQKLLDGKRTRVDKKSRDGDQCYAGKRYRDKNRLHDEKQYSKNEESPVDRRHFDEQRVCYKNRYPNDKRETTDRQEKLRVDGEESCVEKRVRENQVHGENKLREERRSPGEKVSFKAKKSGIDEKQLRGGKQKSDDKVSSIKPGCVEKFELCAKSHKQDVKDNYSLPNNAAIQDDNKIPNANKQILNGVCISRDPRLKTLNARSSLLTKPNQSRKDIPIVEPPVLLKGERRAVSTNIVHLNKSPTEKNTSATQNSSQPPEKDNPRVSLLKEKLQQSVPKLSKRESARRNSIQQKIRRRENEWRRQTYPWARSLPVSKKRGLVFSPEEKKTIKSTRREKLKGIAERQNNLRTDVSATITFPIPATDLSPPIPAADTPLPIPEGDLTLHIPKRSVATAVSVPEENVTDQTSAQRVAAQSLNLTPASGAYYLYCKPLEPAKKKFNKRNEYSESSDTEDEAVKNGKNDARQSKSSATHSPGTVRSSNNAPEESRRVAKRCESKSDDLMTLRIEKPFKLKAKESKTQPQLVDFLSNIFQWNPTWLEEEQQCNIPPPVVDESKLIAMLARYQSFEHYYKIVEPLLALEMWHAISDDYKVGKKTLKLFSIVPYSIGNSENFERLSVSTLELEIVVSEQDLQLEAHPSNGDLLFFNYLSNRRDQWGFLRWTVFAYVTGFRKTVITPLTKFDRNLLTTGKNPHTLITLTVMTKALDPTDVQMHRVYELQKIMYIRSNIRMVQAVQQLHTSPLMNMILNPKLEDYQLLPANNVREYHLVTKNHLNTKQLEAVIRVTEAAVQKLPKICLIQGPPGTGKSKVIVNLILQILYGGHRSNSDKKLKILMCAPSNTAIDEIVLRLLEIQQSLGKKNCFSLVRTGRINTMHPNAKAVSLQEMARKGFDQIVNEHSSLSFSSNAVQSHCERSERRQFRKGHRDAEHKLLKSADIIASTLTSCYTSQMESALCGSEDTDLVCIVDEATQCTEPESLIPLILGVKTLVLVGDTNQLPATVLSQKAKHLGLDQSLFARIARVFEGTPNNPVIQLDVQYRMTVPVALFPNKYFYGGTLKNAARMHKLPFHLYRVINLDSTQDHVKFSNSDEANFVANLIYTMIARTNYGDAQLPVRVGIITPYKNQKILLMKTIKNCIARLKDKNKIDFEVNTVDSYQGQERDVIIMSCVRSNGIGFLSDPHRLCVALTRAKHSLIMCGNFKTFQKDPMWNALLADARSRGVYVNVKSDSNPGDIRPYIIR